MKKKTEQILKLWNSGSTMGEIALATGLTIIQVSAIIAEHMDPETLIMIENSVKNMKQGKVGKTFNPNDHKDLLDQDD